MKVIRIRKPLVGGATWVSRSDAPSRAFESLSRARNAVGVL